MKVDPAILAQLVQDRLKAEKAAAAAESPAETYRKAQQATNEKFLADVSTEQGYAAYREQLERSQAQAAAAQVEAQRREDKKPSALQEHEELVAAACVRERMINPGLSEYQVLSNVYEKRPDLYHARIS